MMIYSVVAQEHPQDMMTVDEEHSRTRLTREHTREHGSREPAIMEHYKTLYYLIIYSVYDATLQVHGIIHNLLLFPFALISSLKTR